MSTATERHQAIFLIGPWLVGSFIDIFLQGILMCQFSNYWTWYKDDGPFLKLVVFGLAFLTILKSVQCFVIVWIQNILYMGDVSGAVVLITQAWWQAGNPLMVATISAYAQAFFLYRLYIISQRKWVVIPLGIVFIFAYIAMIIGTITIQRSGDNVSTWFAAYLSSVFVADITMSLATVYFLLKSRKSVLPRTVSIIDSLVRLTLSSAVPAAICAMFNLIFSQVYSGSENLISTAFNQALPKCYAVSMLWTLNERRRIRAVGDSYDNNFTTDGQVITPIFNRRCRTNLGIDTSDGIQMHSETVKRIEVNDMFLMEPIDESEELSLHDLDTASVGRVEHKSDTHV